MSHLPNYTLPKPYSAPLEPTKELHELFREEIEQYIDLLIKQYPKHGRRKPLTWVLASWELQVSEMSVRNYIEQRKLKDLKIPAIAEFMVLEDIKERIAEDKKNAQKK